jgi:hypothetical protein
MFEKQYSDTRCQAFKALSQLLLREDSYENSQENEVDRICIKRQTVSQA